MKGGEINMKDTKIAKYDDTYLRNLAGMGMRNVPKDDIRPPQILLAQKMSDFDNMVTLSGEKPNVGQYFNTGTLKILDDFECYFVYAAKSKYIDKNKIEEDKKDQYKAVGVMDDGSVFGMTFRSSGLYALSTLFSMTASQMRPLFSIRVKMEQKELSNDKGKWFIPVCRVVGMENDVAKLTELEQVAQRFDSKSDIIFKEDQENVDPDDIPSEFE